MALKTRNKDYKATFKSKDILLPDIHRHVMKKSMEPDDERRTDVLHPSEMAKAGWCPRLSYYQVVGECPSDSSMNSFRTESIFDYGHSVHRKWQGWLDEMGVLWGQWECLNSECGLWFYATSPRRCELCGGLFVEYKEVPIVDDEWLLVGHADGAIEELKAIIEIKSIGEGSVRIEASKLYQQFIEEQLTMNELWFRINRPFSAHIRQAMLYLHFMRLRYGAEKWDKLIFIYEWKANQDAKEFVIKYNKAYIDKTLVAMQDVVSAKNEGIPPERPDWAMPSHRTCKVCPAKTVCYGKNRSEEQESQSSTSGITIVKSTTARRRRALGK